LRVILVADDLLHGLPFSLLVERSIAAGHTKSGTVEVIRANSAASYYAPGGVTENRYSDESIAAQNPSIVVFADPDFGGVNVQLGDAYRSWVEELPRLVYSSTEAQYIKTPHSSVELYLGAQATTENLVSSTARQADILHIATHGYYNPKTPSIVGLATAGRGEGSGFLSLSRLFDVDYHANLVVISACETMLGRQYKGVGVSGLADGLLASGAGAVVGTLWQVSDKATALFMRSFYQNLLATNGDAAKALAATKDQFKSSARYSSPHFWAGMVLQSSHQSYSHDVFTRRNANRL
jgi:CHAT domain-containing protein